MANVVDELWTVMNSPLHSDPQSIPLRCSIFGKNGELFKVPQIWTLKYEPQNTYIYGILI